MVCLGTSYHFKFFKGFLSQILLGPFLNTLTQMKALYIWTCCADSVLKCMIQKETRLNLVSIFSLRNWKQIYVKTYFMSVIFFYAF